MIIDHSNIHGWLQNQIEIATVREANFIKDLLDCGGEDAETAILTAFVTQGAACGKVAADELNKGEHTPQEIYQIMQNYYLNGMLVTVAIQFSLIQLMNTYGKVATLIKKPTGLKPASIRHS